MNIIKSEPFENGNYPPIQENWNQSFIPEGYYIWQDGLDTTNFYKYNGFVTLNVIRNTVIGYELNEEARNKWKENNPGGSQEENPPQEGQDNEEEISNTEILNILLGI